MKLTDLKDNIRKELQHNSEFIRIKNTVEGKCWAIIEVEDIPFIIFRNNTPPHEVFLSYLTLPVFINKTHEVGYFSNILKELLNE